MVADCFIALAPVVRRQKPAESLKSAKSVADFLAAIDTKSVYLQAKLAPARASITNILEREAS